MGPASLNFSLIDKFQVCEWKCQIIIKSYLAFQWSVVYSKESVSDVILNTTTTGVLKPYT